MECECISGSASDRVLDVLLERGLCTTSELAEAVGLDKDAVRRVLRSLRRWELAAVAGTAPLEAHPGTELVFEPTAKARTEERA